MWFEIKGATTLITGFVKFTFSKWEDPIAIYIV